jgi:uncharacterized membrane protein YfcA
VSILVEHWPLVMAFIAAGVGGGLLAGLLGVGGGIVIVPVLFVVFTTLSIDDGIAMKIAVATSLSTIIFTSLSSARSHYKRGATDMALFRAWLIPILLGVILGTLTGGLADGRLLTLVFAIVAVLVAVNMLLRRNAERVSDGFPRAWLKHASGVGVGYVSALMGIGGGTISVPILTAVGYDMRRAVGTSSAIGFLIAIPGTLGYVAAGLGQPGLPPFSLGYLNFAAGLALVPLTMLFAPLGARIAHAVPRSRLQLAFGVFLLLTAARMLYSLVA